MKAATIHAALTLPGDGIDALFKAGAIPDPYWGRNEYGLRWICQRDWVASAAFAVDRAGSGSGHLDAGHGG